jgi:putative glutamine amidotransferase
MRPLILVPYPQPDYVEALENAGAEVRTLTDPSASGDPFDGIDGVLLTGGRDVDPALYDAPRHPETRDSEPGRDALELAIAKRALAAGVPLLAICRGLQVLNVAAGGTLVQDIPTEVDSAVPHDVREPKAGDAHPVRVTPGSKVALALAGEIDERGETLVNSRHHQAVDRLAPGLEVTAVAPDGLAEAIETPGDTFCVGVQWHPENFHGTGRFRGLFEAFVGAAERRVAP